LFPLFSGLVPRFALLLALFAGLVALFALLLAGLFRSFFRFASLTRRVGIVSITLLLLRVTWVPLLAAGFIAFALALLRAFAGLVT
jgi:hypothetical protein